MQAGLLVATPPQGTPPVLPPGQLPATGIAKLQPGADFGDELIKALSDALATEQPAATAPAAAACQVAQVSPLPPAALPAPPGPLPAAAPQIPGDPAALRPRGAQQARRDPNARDATADAATAPIELPASVPALPQPVAALVIDSAPPQAPASTVAQPDVAATAANSAAPPPPVAHLAEPKQPAADTASMASRDSSATGATLPAPLPTTTGAANPDLLEQAAGTIAGDVQPQSPTTATASTAQPVSHGSRDAAPAAQIAPALMSLSHTTDGTQRLTMRLDPPELGQVQIRIERPLDAPARVEITVERAETLTLLLRDQPQLQRALDQAGVPPDGRSVTFHVATPESGARSDGPPAPNPGANIAGQPGSGSGGTPRQHGNPQQRTGNAMGDSDTELSAVALPTWLRAGLDITA